MKHIFVVLGLAAAMIGCSRSDTLEIPKGSDVTVQKRDGARVTGRLVEVQPNEIVLEARNGDKVHVPRADIESVKATPAQAEASPAPAAGEAEPRSADPPAPAKETPSAPPESSAPAPAYREVTVPSGTVLPVELETAVGSDTSHVEDQVRGTLRRSVTIDGLEAIPRGTAVLGHVTAVERPGKIKGRGTIAVRFSRIDMPGDGDHTAISTDTISRLAPATKKQDAAKIGGGAAGGAIIGGILGGGSGAAKGATIGGGAGTAVVLSTRGADVRIAAGTPLSVKLKAPLTIRVAIK